VLASWNLIVLVIAADAQAAVEQASRDRVLDSLASVIAHPADQALLYAPADPHWAPDALGVDLLDLYRAGQLSPRP
jgi:hypothetical protein